MSDGRFKKGAPSPNKYGRGGDPNKKKLPKSKLRNLEVKLYKLSPQAIENISKSINGEEVDKEVLSTSKWVVSQITMLSKSALSEELTVMKVNDPSVEAQVNTNQRDPDEGDSGGVVVDFNFN